jgi:hypothetical protein
MLEPAIDGPLAALLRRKASELQGCVLGVGVASDHVHIVVQQRRRGLLEFTAMTQVRIRR